MTGIISPGLYFDMPTDEYFADPAPEPSLSQSLVKVLIEQSPLHARQAHPRLAVKLSEDEEPAAEKYDAAKAIGNAMHAITLGRGKVCSVIDQPNFTTKEAKIAKAAALNAGHEPVLRKHWMIANQMYLALKFQLNSIPDCELAFRLDAGDSEVIAVANEDGLWLRTMMDFVTKDLRQVWDLKTSGMSAAPWNTGKVMASAGWQIQAAMHERILDAIDPEGRGRRRFFYVMQENEAPFALTVSEIGEAALTIGRKQIQYAVDAWRSCLQSGQWPAYPARINRPELPGWVETSWINREIEEYEERQAASLQPKMLNSLAGG